MSDLKIYWLVVTFLGFFELQAQDRYPISFVFNQQWHGGSPALVYERYPDSKQKVPLVYSGVTQPRGQLVLRAPGAEEGEFVVRGGDIDITRVLTIKGAQHWDEKGMVTWFNAEQLPSIRVDFEPQMPDRINFPGSTPCMLKYEIGEKQDKWATGKWMIYLRIDVTKFPFRLEPSGTKTIQDPDLGESLGYIYTLEFNSREMKTDADFHNLFYYEFQTARFTDLEGHMDEIGITKLNALLEVYPGDGELLFERANYYADKDSFARALADANTLLSKYESGKLTKMFYAPMSHGMHESIDLLRLAISGWTQLKNEQEDE